MGALLNSSLHDNHNGLEHGGALLHNAWVATYVTSTLYTAFWDVRYRGDVGEI